MLPVTIARISLLAACLGTVAPITWWAIAYGHSVVLPSICVGTTALTAFVLGLETVHEAINLSE